MAWAPSWAPLGPFVEEIFWASNIWCVVKISAPFGLGRVMKLVGFLSPMSCTEMVGLCWVWWPMSRSEGNRFFVRLGVPNSIAKCGFGIG